MGIQPCLLAQYCNKVEHNINVLFVLQDIDVSDRSLSDESDHIGDDDDDDEFANPFGTFNHCDPYFCGRAQRTGRPCHWNDQRNHGHQFQHRFKQYDHMVVIFLKALMCIL